MKWSRPGDQVNGLKLGRWRCIRQEWMTPGVCFPKLSGWIKLQPLREQQVTDIKATLDIRVA